MCRSRVVVTSVLVSGFASILLFGAASGSMACHSDHGCDDAASNAAKVLRPAIEDNQLHAQDAELAAEDALRAAATVASRKRSVADRLKLLVEALGCKNPQRCCQQLAAEPYATRRERAMGISSVLSGFDEAPPQLSDRLGELRSAADRLWQDAATDAKRSELVTSCEAIRSQVATLVQVNETAWVEREAAAKKQVEDARAAVPVARARTELLESWRQALVERRAIDVAESAGDPGARPAFRDARRAMLAYTQACR